VFTSDHANRTLFGETFSTEQTPARKRGYILGKKRDAPEWNTSRDPAREEDDFLKSARPARIASQTHPDFLSRL
jgi:hypothetical protein